MDKEFYTIDVINRLQEMDIPFIIPYVQRGRNDGIRNLFMGGKSYSAAYTMKSCKKQATFQVNVVAKYSKGKHRHKGSR